MSNEFFRSIKSNHEELEVFFQIMLFIKCLRRRLSLVDSCRRTEVFTKTELFHRDLQNICFDIKEYLFRRTAFGGCFWNKWIQTYVSDT